MPHTAKVSRWIDALLADAHARLDLSLRESLFEALNQRPLPEVFHAAPPDQPPEAWSLEVVATAISRLGTHLGAKPTTEAPSDPTSVDASEDDEPAPSASPSLGAAPVPHGSPESEAPGRIPPTRFPSTVTPPPFSSMSQAIYELRKFASWGTTGLASLAETKRRFDAQFPDKQTWADNAVAEGHRLGARQADLIKRLGAHGPDDAETLAAFDRLVRDVPALRSWANKQYQFVRSKLAQRPLASRLETEAPLSAVTARGDHAIWRLPAAAAYTMLIDETGTDFGAERTPKATRGRFVGLVYADQAPPPELLNFHAVTQSLEEIDAAVQALLDHATGIVGVTVDGLPETPGDRWRSGVLELVEWALRLLPLDGPTELTVLVENRADNVAGDRWRAAADALRRNLAECDAGRAALIPALRIEVVGKDHPQMAYVDALAYTWGTAGTKNRHSRARLNQSGLGHLLLTEGAQLRQDFDRLRSTERFEAKADAALVDTWWHWIGNDAAQRTETLTAFGLEQVSGALKRAPRLWADLVARIHVQLDGLEIDLRHLGSALQWLNAHRPTDSSLPPRLEFMWALARLIEDAHRGSLESEQLEHDFERLRSRLYEEDARLVCLADLYRATADTNAFDFSGASERLQSWTALPMALAGRRLYGRVASSLGQHAAFEGRLDEALEYIDGAVDVFDELTDAGERDRELSQTRTYRAIVLMDTLLTGRTPSAGERSLVVDAVEAVVGPLSEAAQRLNAQAHPRDKYAQHLLWRLAATGQVPEFNAALLAGRSKWKTGEGHPWPLVEFYRALLLFPVDPQAAGARAAGAIDLAIAETCGPTVNLIGLAIAIASRKLGVTFDAIEGWLDYLDATLPQAAEAIEVLRHALANPSPPEPLALLGQVLPFNFR